MDVKPQSRIQNGVSESLLNAVDDELRQLR